MTTSDFFKKYPLLLPALVVLFCIIDISLLPAKVIPSTPNVIVISIDSLRADHMGLYGYTRDTTPAIDAFAKNGFVFDNYYATSYLTPISEGSVQTGAYPFDSGIINFSATATDKTQFLAQILKSHGYTTAAFGSSPEYTVNGALAEDFSRGFDVYSTYPANTEFPLGVSNATGRKSLIPVTKAVSWLQSGRDMNRPFYLWLPLGGVHAPYNDTELSLFGPPYNGFLSKNPYDEFANVYGFIFGDTHYAVGNPAEGPLRALGPFTSVDTQRIIDRYDDGVFQTDELLSKLFAYLKESGLDQNTLVVIESEHGETLGERGYFWHYDIYDETVHAPLIIRAPGAISGKRVDAFASGVDVLQTILSFIHLPAPHTDGVNWYPYLVGLSTSIPRNDVLLTRTPLWEGVDGRLPAFSQEDNTAHFYDTAISSKKWKLIHRVSRTVQEKYGWWGLLTGHPQLVPEYELYDVANDPGEKNNVNEIDKNDPEVEALRLKLDVYESSIRENMPGPTNADLQPYF